MQRIGHALRDLIKQTEVGSEDAAHREDEHHYDNRLEHRHRDVFRLLPLARAVKHRGLVKRSVDAGDAGQIHDHAVTRALPDLEDHEEEGPVPGFRIPAVRLSAKGLDELVEQTVVGIEKSKDEITHNDPRKEVREEHHRLIDLRFALGIQLVDHQRQRYGNDDAQDDKNDIIEPLITCDFLFIDDLGTEPVYKNVTIEYLFLILNERLNLNKHTIITTNLSLKEIKEHYGDRLFSRIINKDTNLTLELSGKDKRLKTN